MTKRTWYAIGVLMTIAMLAVAVTSFVLALSGRAPHWIFTVIFWVDGVGALLVGARFIDGMIGGYQSGGRAR